MARKNDIHLERNEILKAIAEGVKPSTNHFEACSDCLSLYEALLHFKGVGGEILEDPSEHLIEKLAAIPQLVGARPACVSVCGQVVFDSWRDLPAAEVRDAALVRERRLRFAYGSIVLEIVAERLTGGWEFTARVYDGEITTCRFVLKVGRERIAPELHDCYYFTRATLPKHLTLLSPDLQIAFSLPGPGHEVKR